MAGGLDSADYGRSSPPQGSTWSPNYADVVQPYVRPASQAADYLQQLQAPDYLQYAMGIPAGSTQAIQRVAYDPTTAGAVNPADRAAQTRSYLQSLQGQSGYNGALSGPTAYDRAPYVVPTQASPGAPYVAPYEVGAQTPAPVTPANGGQWRAGYGSDVNNNFRPAQPTQVAQAPANGGQWRAGYGSDVNNNFRPGTPGAPATPGTPTGQYRPPYGADAPGNTGQPRDPNANGNATITAPPFRPGPQPVMQYQRPGQPGQVATIGDRTQTGAGGGTFWQQQDAIITAVNKKLGGASASPNLMYATGAAGGVFGGNVIPYVGNAMARSVLGDPAAASRTSFLNSLTAKLPEGMQAKVQPGVDALDNHVANLGERWAGPADGWRQRVANAWVDNFDKTARAAKELALQRSTAKDALPGLMNTRDLAVEAQARYLKEIKDVKNMTDVERTTMGELTNAKSAAELAFKEAETIATTEQAGRTVGNMVKETGGKFVGNAVRGAAMAGVGMLVDNYLDRLDGHDHKYGLSATTALSLPFAIALGQGKGLVPGLAIAGVTAVAGHYGGQMLDGMLTPQQSQSFSRALQPNGFDAFSMGTAIALPTNDVRTKLALVGTGWTLGRMQNTGAGEAALWGAGGTLAAIALAPNPEMKVLVAGLGVAGYIGTRFTSKDGQQGVNMNNDAWDALKGDQTTRTKGSMDTAIGKFAQLGAETPGTLTFYWLDWMNRNRNFDSQLSAYRGGAILSASLGETLLAKGTLMPSDKTQSTFIPGTSGLDIGGDAYRKLLIAQNCLNNAQKATQNPTEIADLKSVGDQVTSTINSKILGRHDMNNALDLMTGWYHQHLQDGGQLTERITAGITANIANQNANPQFVAKLCRDSALMKMALAKFNIGHDAGSAASLMYGGNPAGNGQVAAPDGVFNLLDKARQLDPNNPDLQQLQDLANGIGNQMPAAVRAQYANPHYNPLNVNNGLPATTR